MLIIILLVESVVAHADPVVLRFATAAPEGTAWARLFRAMGRDLVTESKGAVQPKWYFGGIAGDEGETLERMKRGQLDGVLSGGMLCMRLAPSLRVLRLLGLFESRDEATYVMSRLRPIVDAEFLKEGFQNFAEAGLGLEALFTRNPIRSMADLRRERLWVWNLDDAMRPQLEGLGVPVMPLPVNEASAAFEARRVDAFLSVPTAALAFQWSVQAHYLTQIRLGFLAGCVIVSTRAFDSMPLAARRALSLSVAQFAARLEDLGRAQDQQLLGGLFAKQGLREVEVSPAFRTEYAAAFRSAREAARGHVVPGDLIDRVNGWLADYRREHPVR